ncbi:MAG: monofunctional biosynthetic peptidoglycan transglycosylase [Alistipes indistinctus]
MVRAVIATEDNNFLTHRGFDWDAINKALDENREGGRIRGGSTISQQTAKNVFCLPSRTWTRKAVEAYYTFLIETFWDKRRIMEVYLNVIETGENMYGVEAPARQVYGKTAEHLNRHEASMIASVLPNPIRMKIAAPSSYVVRRAAQVRSLMSKLPQSISTIPNRLSRLETAANNPSPIRLKTSGNRQIVRSQERYPP